MEPIYTLGNYESDIKPIMNALEQASRKQLSRSCSTYYTQHTKCNDIRDMDSFDPTEDRGQDLCSNYLVPELKLVQPDVVLVMGGKPDNHLQRAMEDLGVSRSKIPNRVKDIVFEDPEESADVRTYETDLLDTTTILPSYHYGAQALRSMKDYTVIDSDEEYWRVLSQKAASYFS
jgi:uracil-DNA glycosylase